MRVALNEQPFWSAQEKLDQELAAIGFYFSGHPLDDILDNLDVGRVTLAIDITEQAQDGKPLELIGVVRRRVEKPARNGGKFAFLTLSDPSGETELVVMPELLSDMRDQIEPGKSVSIMVDVRRREEEIRLNARLIKPIEQARIVKPAVAVCVNLAPGANLEGLASILSRLKNAPGSERGQIFVRLKLDGEQSVTLGLPDRYATGLDALRALKTVPGVMHVETQAQDEHRRALG